MTRASITAVINHARQRAGIVRNRDLAEMFGHHQQTATKYLQRYMRRGLLERLRRGVYRLTPVCRELRIGVPMTDRAVALASAGSIGTRDVVKALGVTRQRANQILRVLRAAGRLERVRRDEYRRCA
jgi:predicted transcriptional regulator of viral defense system